MKTTRATAGLATLIAAGLAFATPAAAEPSPAPETTAVPWVCTFEVNEGGLGDVTWYEAPELQGHVAVGDRLESEGEYLVVGSVTKTPPTAATCRELMKTAIDKERNDPAKTKTAWNCIYQATEKGLVFYTPSPRGQGDVFEPASNPVAFHYDPAVAKMFKGDWVYGEGMLNFTVAITDRGAASPGKAACDAHLPIVTPKVDAQQGTHFADKYTEKQPTKKPTQGTDKKPTKAPTTTTSKAPTRGVPAKTGAEDELPVVPLGLAGLALAGGAGALAARRRG